MARALSPLQWLFIALVRIYQYCISPFLGPACRFYPSCSHYAVDAIRKHGCFYGVWLTCKRLLRCHPLCTGGVDPVPEPKHKDTKDTEA